MLWRVHAQHNLDFFFSSSSSLFGGVKVTRVGNRREMTGKCVCLGFMMWNSQIKYYGEMKSKSYYSLRNQFWRIFFKNKSYLKESVVLIILPKCKEKFPGQTVQALRQNWSLWCLCLPHFSVWLWTSNLPAWAYFLKCKIVQPSEITINTEEFIWYRKHITNIQWLLSTINISILHLSFLLFPG